MTEKERDLSLELATIRVSWAEDRVKLALYELQIVRVELETIKKSQPSEDNQPDVSTDPNS